MIAPAGDLWAIMGHMMMVSPFSGRAWMLVETAADQITLVSGTFTVRLRIDGAHEMDLHDFGELTMQTVRASGLHNLVQAYVELVE